MGLNALFYLIILIVAILWVRSGIQRRQDIMAGKKYCEENGLIFVDGKIFEQHIRLYFEKEGVKGWANYTIDKDGQLQWVKETPLEKLQHH
ncbi:MAG: hypothetical protein KDC85_21385 [Saprospiraceae bacterium]|nr:hypothetical protein [Saprospiraceae bacterium]MCB9324323.1 hypothetical protein [Lewinellaceae bacterium]